MEGLYIKAGFPEYLEYQKRKDFWKHSGYCSEKECYFIEQDWAFRNQKEDEENEDLAKADIRKETKHKIVTKKDREDYLKMLEGQVETYNQYIMGEVYGFVVTAPEDDGWVGDSCWGYYGDSDYCISEAKEAIDSRIDELEAEKCDEVDNIMYFDAITEPFWID